MKYEKTSIPFDFPSAIPLRKIWYYVTVLLLGAFVAQFAREVGVGIMITATLALPVIIIGNYLCIVRRYRGGNPMYYVVDRKTNKVSLLGPGRYWYWKTPNIFALEWISEMSVGCSRKIHGAYISFKMNSIVGCKLRFMNKAYQNLEVVQQVYDWAMGIVSGPNDELFARLKACEETGEGLPHDVRILVVFNR